MGLLPIDETTKTELEETTKAVLKTFTTQYLKWTAIFMVKDAQQAVLEKEDEKLVLLKRPEDAASTEPLKSGWITKQGGSVKNWKKRFLVAHPNCIPAYYEKEADVNDPKKKPKGFMNLHGYRVVTDPNNGKLQQLKKLAEKMKIDLSELPKPKEYPPFTFELHHYRRRCYFVTCENQTEFDAWVKVMGDVCWRAPGYVIEDSVHRRAFSEAIVRTRWELGRWGWYSYGGTEEQILSDLISDELDYAVTGKIWDNIKGPWIIRRKIQKKTQEFIDSLVGAAVKPAWAAAYGAVKELKPKVQPALERLGTEIGKVEMEVREKITKSVMNIINPLLQKHVIPHLGGIFDIIRSPMKDSSDAVMEFFSKSVDSTEVGASAEEKRVAFRKLDYAPWSWAAWDCFRPTEAMVDPLYTLGKVFPNIWPWWSVYQAQRRLRDTLDAAIWTYQQKLEEVPNREEAKQRVLKDFKKDLNTESLQWYAEVFKNIIMPPLESEVMPAVASVLEPISENIPDDIKQFVDPEEVFAGILEHLVDEMIGKTLKGLNKAADKHVESEMDGSSI